MRLPLHRRNGAVFAEVRETVEADARRLIAVSRACEKVRAYYKEAFAQRLGLPSACVEGSLHLDRFQTKANELARQIRKGEVNIVTDAEVEAAFRSLADDAVAERADRIAAIDGMEDISPALADRLKEHILEVDRPEKVDIASCVKAARDELSPFIADVEAALAVPNAEKTAVYEAMRAVSSRLGAVVHGLFPPGEEVGGEEEFMLGTPMMATLIHDRPGLAEKLTAFFARPDVQGDDFFNPLEAANSADPFRRVLPEPQAREELAASLGTTAMPPFHAQALFKAFEDAGLGALSAAERMAVLRPSHPAGAALADAIRNEPGAVSPNRLRELATPILQSRAHAAPFARSQADAARMESLLEKYGGGLAPADRERLREFADVLDFSEQGATASETAIAGRLDEICGGGGFDNPASSASRRAIASGASAEDLRFLSHCAKLLDASRYTPEEILDRLADPQSALRRPLDAALARFAGNPPRALSFEQKIRVAIAVFECSDDADLLEIVTHGIARVIATGTSALRDEADVIEIVANVRSNLEEVREAAAGDPEALAAGMELLKGLETRRAPAGYIRYMIDAARRAPIDAVAKLRRRSSPAEIHAALLQLNKNIAAIRAGRDAEGLLNDADEALACRNFLLRTMVSRLTESQRRNLRDALASQNAVQTAAFYDAVAAEEVEMPAMPFGLRERLTTIAASLARDAGFLYGVVRRSLGEENAGSRLPPLEGELNPPRIGAQAMFNEIQATARADIDAAREAYLGRAIPGTSQAATAMRSLFATRLAVTQPIDPEPEIETLFTRATANQLNINIARRAKELATGQNFALTQFAKDRDRGMDVFLPDGTLLSTDPAKAADELARFVTGRGDATYAALNAAEKTKVHVVMSLLTQESSTAVIEVPATALDPEEKKATFSFGGNGGALTRSFRLEQDAAGGITVRFETTVRPSNLVVDGDLVPLGAGSSISGGYALTLSAEQLGALGNLDFATCDLGPADQVLTTNPPVARKLRTAVTQLPQAFQLDLQPTTTLSFVLN